MSSTLITAVDFAQTIQSETPVVVKFGANWCGPCKAYEAAVPGLQAEFGDRVRFFKVDTDDEANRNNDEARSMKKAANTTGAIPHITIFRSGELQHTIIGNNQAELRAKLEEMLSSL